jgi:hypothetical protein
VSNIFHSRPIGESVYHTIENRLFDIVGRVRVNDVHQTGGAAANSQMRVLMGTNGAFFVASA